MRGKKRTDAEYRAELKEKRPDLELLDFYVNEKTKLRFRCKYCKNILLALPILVLKGQKCRECHPKITPLEKMLIKLKEVWGGLIEYIGGYTKMGKKCWFRCAVCNYIWYSSPVAVLRGRGCWVCGHVKRRVSLEEMLRRVKEVWGDEIEYVSGYTKMSAKCKWRCKHGHEWYAEPREIVRGRGCVVCYYTSKIIPLDEIIKRVAEINPNVEYVSDYVNTKLRCWWRCKICNHLIYVSPHNLLNGQGCGECIKESLEKPVMEVLDKKGINYKHNKELEGCVYNKRPLRPDFYIKTDKGILWVECDGRQHYEPIYGEDNLKEQQVRDMFKDNYCKEHSICLIRVVSSPTKEWGVKNHITLEKLIELIEIGINSETKEINFDLFWQYDFNRE